MILSFADVEIEQDEQNATPAFLGYKLISVPHMGGAGAIGSWVMSGNSSFDFRNAVPLRHEMALAQ